MPDTITIKMYPKAYYTGTKSLDGIPFRLKIHWNTTLEKWYLDISSQTGDPIIIRGKALLPGTDLLRPHGWSHVLGSLRVVDTSGANENPDFDGMGDRWILQYTPLDTD